MSDAHWFSLRGRRESDFLHGRYALSARRVGHVWSEVPIHVGGIGQHIRYEPVDVPPREVSPRHQKEREEYERRDRAVTEQNQ